MSDLPYVSDVRDVRRALRLVERGTMPSTVTAKHLAANGIPEDDADRVRELLESLDFVTSAGVPTPVWVGYRESDDRPGVLGEAMRATYAPLLEAGSTEPDALAQLVTEQGDVPGDVVPQVVSTFLALCELSEHLTDSPVSPVARQRRAVVSHISRLLQTSISEFDTARVCLQHDLRRPAVVAAWSSYAALAFAHLADDDFAILRTSARRATLDADDLMRRVSGAELIELLLVAELIGPADRAVLECLLHERDDCARPSPADPDREQVADYLSRVLAQSDQLTRHPLGHTSSAVPAGDVSAV
ncbi:DUF5343 domain-containing protein [Aeromicrobium fastidiosum]|uniref:Uncharacterized protein n=1 Tax=Aeromicrobium fastidiosum TaxID=52699 RepID=A0A641AKN3_9ACTN|nr:DUF5343 domain-containing protein [Aeromicrobium fastidiosum]KAA1376387.1 hypothetical protein ESP62_013225 [Aeromicrobium fastidiosum]MBP2391706.1 hypothetical protein [Aeromicrobium fastidiosum]